MPVIQIPAEYFVLLERYLPWIILIGYILYMRKPTRKKTSKEVQIESAYKANALATRYTYNKLNIIPPFEMAAYQKIKAYADSNGLIVCPKVHMRHLVAPERDLPETANLERMIQNHVDFVLCTPEMHIVKVIMLISKNESDLKATWIDIYRKVFTKAGHEIVFTDEITDEILRCK